MEINRIVEKSKDFREKHRQNTNKDLHERVKHEATDTIRRVSGEVVSVGLSGIPDEVWKALKKDKEQRLKNKKNEN